jgi:hypothetical protein
MHSMVLIRHGAVLVRPDRGNLDHMPFQSSRLRLSLLSFGLTAVVLSLASQLCFAQTGFRFLELGVGSRAVAMGEAYTSLAADPSAVYWNPAGLARMDGVQVHLTHAEWLLDVRHEYAGAAMRFGRHAVGGSVSGLFTGDIDRRDDKGRQIGTYGYYDMAAAVSYGYEARPDLWLGGTVKYLREGIDHYSGNGFAADLGAQWALPWTGVMAGAALRHLGPGITVNAEESKLPTTFQGGVSVRRPLGAGGKAVVISVEARKSRDEVANILYGAEYQFPSIASLQFGYQSGMDNNDISVGARVARGMYAFSYAYVPYTNDWDDTHRLSLDIAF